MNKLNLIFLSFFLVSCSGGIIPIPNTLMPERYSGRVASEEYGKYPSNYQKILKDYLINNIRNHNDAKIEFVNRPSKLSIEHIGSIYSGYRLCLSINARNNKNIFTGYKTHLFIINNDKVDLHLFDSGLLKIPFELCVDRDETRTIILDDISDDVIEQPEITIDKMDEIVIPKKPDDETKSDKNIYILCNFGNSERTFVFNERRKTLSESVGIEEIDLFDVKFSSTHILGYKDSEEILINRVSGSVTITTENLAPVKGDCNLLDKTKF